MAEGIIRTPVSTGSLLPTLLELTGIPEPGKRLSQYGLDVWQAEVADSYNCFEHFIAQTGRGAGCSGFAAGCQLVAGSW
mgnify:CR=1 FL=1